MLVKHGDTPRLKTFEISNVRRYKTSNKKFAFLAEGTDGLKLEKKKEGRIEERKEGKKERRKEGRKKRQGKEV